MADEFDFKAFEQEIGAWAEGTSQEARSAFASQCAARVLPNIGGSTRPEDDTGFSFDLTLLRAILTSAVAGEIERIKTELREKRAEKFEDHIRTLVPRFTILAPQANRLADLIDEALREFHNEVEVNRLPDSIEPLCKLPPILRKIALEMAGTASDDTKVESIAKLVAAMSETITELNIRLERANKVAPDARTLEQSRLGQFFNSNGMSGWLIAGTTTFFSVMTGVAGDATIQQTLNLTVEQICITDFPEEEQPQEFPESLIEEPQELPNPTIDL